MAATAGRIRPLTRSTFPQEVPCSRKRSCLGKSPSQKGRHSCQQVPCLRKAFHGLLLSGSCSPKRGHRSPAAIRAYVGDREKKDLQEEKPPTIEGVERFEWASNWYPVVIERDLDKKRPRAVTILGRPVVIWWDENSKESGPGVSRSAGTGTSRGSWRAFWDACPHRLAPLSEGRVDEKGNLQCAYHGWSFDGEGNCTNIPQAENPTAKSSKRACAKAFPTKAAQGLVWVWPDPEGLEKAEKTPLPTVPELDDPNFYGEIVSREFPYGYEMLAENLLDASHLPFAHHKLIGNRSNGKPIPNKVTAESLFGFEGVHEQAGHEWTFSAPTLVVSRMKLPIGGKDPGGTPRQASLIFWVTPVAPGRSRLFFCFPQNFATSAMKLIPRFLWHIGQMPVLDSDLLLLRGEERRLSEARAPGAWARQMYMPARADRFVIAFRNWLTQHAEGGPAFGPGVDNELPNNDVPREQLLDRYNSHVKNCESCSTALSNLQTLQKSLIFGSIFAVAGVTAATAARLPLVNRLGPPTLLLALAMAGSAAGLEPLIKKFYYEDYVHALID